MQRQEMNSGYDLQERRKKRKQQKARKRLLLLKRTVVFLLLVTALVLLGMSPVFNIKGIEVRGNQHYHAEEISSMVNLSGENNAFKTLVYDYSDFSRLIRMRYGKTEDALLASFPYLKEIRVGFVIPGKIRIDVTERKPYAVVTGASANLLIDREGYVLEPVDGTEVEGCMIVNGIKFQDFTPGQALTSTIGDSMKRLESLLSAIDNADSKDEMKLRPTIKSVNLSDVKNLRLFLDSRIAVNMGDVGNADVLNYRVSYLRQIFFKHVGNQSRGTVDFTTGEKPRFIPDVQ